MNAQNTAKPEATNPAVAWLTTLDDHRQALVFGLSEEDAENATMREFSCDVDDIVDIERKPELDEYGDTGVPMVKAMFDLGWEYNCSKCNSVINKENVHMGIVVSDNVIYC
ncbi:hypothetical protein I3271_00050 [Photobacterium leiognathi]|uniref:hypothetical protein n=1 Tax=Photobacterium leiognathi TaxID=553611 RepID=UPI001EE12526|nr:hypothetical protein [Photobacterium leiognathi]MCG3883082.1 hypothetical protein [Photobacterium leiognathi]